MITAKINSGLYRGQSIQLPPQSITRAVSAKVRSAIFNVVDVEGCSILDLFAGGGTLGLEALSRGASNVTFVDKSPSAIRVIRSNVKTLGLESEATVVNQSVEKFSLNSSESFDVVFLDPPYRDFSLALVKTVANLVQLGGILVVSCSIKANFEVPSEYSDVGQKTYGDTRIVYLQKK